VEIYFSIFHKTTKWKHKNRFRRSKGKNEADGKCINNDEAEQSVVLGVDHKTLNQGKLKIEKRAENTLAHRVNMVSGR
jgi:hypothetical protein